jgi:hypothetical protein
MASTRIQVEQTTEIMLLKRLLADTSEKASTAYTVNPQEYARNMEEARNIIGRLADALEVNERSRVRIAPDEVHYSVSPVQLH